MNAIAAGWIIPNSIHNGGGILVQHLHLILHHIAQILIIRGLIQLVDIGGQD